MTAATLNKLFDYSNYLTFPVIEGKYIFDEWKIFFHATKGGKIFYLFLINFFLGGGEGVGRRGVKLFD